MPDADATRTHATEATPDGPACPIRIVLADDHAVVRRGLRLLLDSEPDFEVAEAGDVDGARRYVRGHHPAVLVLDLNMPGGSSLDAIPQLRAEAPDTQIVVLTMQDEPAFARQALGARALGYVLKEAADGELVEAVRRAAAGDSYLNPRLGARVASEPLRGTPDDFTARGRRPAPNRPRAHQRRNRRAAIPVGPHRRDTPRPHPAEAANVLALGARPLRTEARPQRP
jgi:two-component system, NarL family, response regulator NreC